MLTVDPPAPESPPPFDPEVVIREARRRQRRRWLLVGGALIVVIGSVVGVAELVGGQGAPRTTAPGPTTAPTPPAATSLQACQPSQLTLAVTNTGSAAGSILVVGTFENQSPHTCTLDGYPSIQMLTSTGSDITTTTAERTSASGASPPQTIPVGPSQQASFTITTSDGNQFPLGTLPACPAAASLLVTPPGSAQGLVAPISARGGPAGLTALPYTAGQPCGGVTVSAIIPGSAARARCPACYPPPPGEVPSKDGRGGPN